MAIYSELPVYRDSYRLLLEIYKVTNTFSREYKFSLGQDMRRDTLSLFRNLYRANKNQDKREAYRESSGKQRHFHDDHGPDLLGNFNHFNHLWL